MKQLSVELNDRELRFDGVSIVSADRVAELFLRGIPSQQLRVSSVDEDIELFNSQVTDSLKIKLVTQEPIKFDFSWQIPDEFKSLDIEKYIHELFVSQVSPSYTEEQFERAANRVVEELEKFRQRGLFDVLRTIAFVMSEFRRTDQIWGVGRGSSCASYVLFLMGLHCVDPIIFDVDLEEFMHD